MKSSNKATGLKIWEYIKKQNSTSSEALNKVALEGGIVEYTYAEMFEQWEKYASVFSALNMTEENHARVGLLGSTSAEAVFALYGLNMVGAEVSIIATYTSFSIDKVVSTIKNENLTDIILTDDFAQPVLINHLLSNKDELNLNNVLILHIPISGRTVQGMMVIGQEVKNFLNQMIMSPVCMDVLIAKYDGYPISYASSNISDASIILHTSGTTSGTGKPIPLSDSALNSIENVYSILEKQYPELKEKLVSGVTIDLSNSYSFVNQVHGILVHGGTVVMVPGACMNPEFYKSIPEFKQNLLLVTAAFPEMWMRSAEKRALDFSSLEVLVFGGSYVSASDKHRYYDFFTKYGAKNLKIINGYGLTELGGSCILSGDDLDDETIGYLLPGVEILLYDEDNNRYYSAKDAPCSGIMYLRSDLMTSGILDGREVVKIDTIKNKKYVCTNDVIRLDKNGKCYFLGRANRYFINDSGVKYESGRVETAVSRQSGIDSCVVVPVYLKLVHDNIPMLCVKPNNNNYRAKEVIRRALIKVFIIEKSLPEDQIPHRVLIMDEIPRNQNGKVDVYRISRGETEGVQYSVKPIRIGPKMADIVLEQMDEEKDKEEILQNAYKTIAKDIIENNKSNYITEEKTMKQSNPYEFFKSMQNMNPDDFKKMFEDNPYFKKKKDYFEKQKDYYEKQKELCKKMFENNPYFKGYNDYYDKQKEILEKLEEKIEEKSKPNTDRIKEYNKMVKDHTEKMRELTTEMINGMYEENTKFMEACREMVKTGFEEKKAAKSAEKKASAKKTPAKKAPAKKATAKKAPAKKAPAKKAPAKKATAKKPAAK